MSFEWDEAKRRSNLEKHQLDFEDAIDVILGKNVTKDSPYGGEEPREMATGTAGQRYVTVIFTRRGDAYRIISMRRARKNEIREYQAVYGGRTSRQEE